MAALDESESVDGPGFLGLERADDGRWRLPVTDALGGASGQLFGGCGLAAAVAVLESAAERPAAWATCQFVSNAFPPEVVDLDAELVAEGRSMAQGRVVGRVEGREVLSAQVALGTKPLGGGGRWVTMPEVPGPDDCPSRSRFDDSPGELHRRVEQRIATGEWGSEHSSPIGMVRAWLRFPERLAASSVGLAIGADFMPLAIRATLGPGVRGSSLDNTVRFVSRANCEWVLADFRIDAVEAGVGHGTVHLWSPDGELLALASQSCSLRDER